MTATINPTAVFDIECDDWDRFVCGGVLYANGHYADFWGDAEGAFAAEILGIKGNVYAHFGGGYDFKWLLDIAAERGTTCSIAASGALIKCATVGRHLRLFDSFALYPASLAEVTAGFHVAKERLALECVCRKDCGGYCRVKRDAPPKDKARIRAYLRNDCRALMTALRALKDFGAQDGWDLKATVGSSAWQSASSMLDLPPADLTVAEHGYARDAYFGGRVQTLRTGVIRGPLWEYDVCSMYPWALAARELPLGERAMVFGATAGDCFDAERPGIYRAVVHVPDKAWLPPLPLRYKGRVHYPTGKFAGTWTQPELAAARTAGVDVAIRDALVWERSAVLFEPWIRRVFAARQRVGKKGPLGTFLKYYANSLTGKLGAKPERWRYFINPTRIVPCPNRFRDHDGPCSDDECCKHYCNGKCGAMGQLSSFIWRQFTRQLESYSHVEWAAYLTSYARVKLYNRLNWEGEGEHTALYCDTDSVFRLAEYAPDPELGPGLGQFECKGEYSEMRIVAPKVYECLPAGASRADVRAWKVRAKGVKVREGELLRVGVKLPREGIIGFGAGAKTGRLFAKANTGRTLNFRAGDRVEVGKGLTRAPRIAEILGA